MSGRARFVIFLPLPRFRIAAGMWQGLAECAAVSHTFRDLSRNWPVTD
jgi:hypothetical protein